MICREFLLYFQFFLHFSEQRKIAHLVNRLLLLRQNVPFLIGNFTVLAERDDQQIVRTLGDFRDRRMESSLAAEPAASEAGRAGNAAPTLIAAKNSSMKDARGIIFMDCRAPPFLYYTRSVLQLRCRRRAWMTGRRAPVTQRSDLAQMARIFFRDRRSSSQRPMRQPQGLSSCRARRGRRPRKNFGVWDPSQ